MTTRESIIKQAQEWIGKKESNGTHKEIIDIYNSHKPRARGYKVNYNGDPWCATFISALAIKLGATDIIPTECGCEKMINLMKSKGIWVEADDYKAKAGDIIFYHWKDNGKGDCTGWANHVGIVEKVSGVTMTVIEGNLNNSVSRRTIAYNARYIRGYGVPKYSEPVAEVPKPSEPVKTYYPKYNGVSYRVDIVLETIGVPANLRGNWKKRKTIAEANGISNYTGTASQNLKIIALAKEGYLIKP